MKLVKNIFGFDENKKNVILDLDETIINATPTTVYNTIWVMWFNR